MEKTDKNTADCAAVGGALTRSRMARNYLPLAALMINRIERIAGIARHTAPIQSHGPARISAAKQR